jgi:hypothetical protein
MDNGGGCSGATGGVVRVRHMLAGHEKQQLTKGARGGGAHKLTTLIIFILGTTQIMLLILFKNSQFVGGHFGGVRGPKDQKGPF